MKITPTKILYKGEITTKFGEMHKHLIDYNGKRADYLSKYENQTKFKVDTEIDIVESSREYEGTTYWSVKPTPTNGTSNYSRNVKKEQARYSGFALSYAKDLVVSGKITEKQMFPTADKMVKWMVETDKKVENGQL